MTLRLRFGMQGLAATTADEDYPASATGKDGKVYVVHLAFTRGRDFQGARERPATQESPPVTNLGTPIRMIDQPGDLAYLAQPAGGEQLYLRILRGGRWSEPIAVTDGQQELYRPAVSVDGDGRVWVFYSAHLDADENLDYGNWEVMARSFAADAQGNLTIAWDTFDKGDYDVYVATRGDDGELGEPQAVAASLAFEVRPSLAYDRDGRLWIAYESSGDQWGSLIWRC